jgi:hypothetical protein
MVTGLSSLFERLNINSVYRNTRWNGSFQVRCHPLPTLENHRHALFTGGLKEFIIFSNRVLVSHKKFDHEYSRLKIEFCVLNNAGELGEKVIGH